MTTATATIDDIRRVWICCLACYNDGAFIG